MQKQLVLILALLMTGGIVIAEEQQIQEENPTSKQLFIQENY